MKDLKTVLATMAKDKNMLSLEPDEIFMVDTHLVERWNVNFVMTDQDFVAEVVNKSSPETQSAFDNIMVSGGRESDYTQFYDLISQQPLLGKTTSKRRAIIIDAISLAASIVRTLDIQGDVIDIGCHAGIIPEVLSCLIDNRIDGVDPSKEAIKVAKEENKGNQRLRFFPARVPFLSKKKYAFLIAVSSMPENKASRSSFLQGVSDLLRPGGVAMIVSTEWLKDDGSVDHVLIKKLKKLDLGFGFADVLGGYGDMPTRFAPEGCVVLIKGGHQMLPENLAEKMQSDWPNFQSYANNPNTPMRQKTQAFKRSLMSS